MALVLSTIMSTYATALLAAPASLAAQVAENHEAADDAGSVHRKFKLTVENGPQVRSLHGGGNTEYECRLMLAVYWDPENIESTVWTTVADDLTNVMAVLLKQSNRPAGCEKLMPTGPSTIEKVSRKRIEARLDLDVIFREAQDL